MPTGQEGWEMGQELTDQTLGIRIHDINQGLVAVSSGLINARLRRTKRAGVAAQLAALVAGEQVVDYESLLVAAGELQMDDTLVDRGLEDLQTLDWVRVVERPSGNKRIEVKIPRLRDRYSELGGYWKSLHPGEIEVQAISIVDELALLPRHAFQLKDKYDVSPTDFTVITDIGKSAGIIDAYDSPTDGRKVLYSPVYWEEHPAQLFELEKRFKEEEIATAIRQVRNYQGLSCDDVSDAILNASIKSGFLPTVSVDSTGGEKQFIFTPVEGVGKDRKPMYQKAMAILACVRYGQRYAGMRLTYPPEVLLEALKRNKKINPHSEIVTQYSPLVKLRIGRVRKIGSRWSFDLIETPDNLEALDLAIKLASVGEGRVTDERSRQAEQLLLPSGQFKTQIKTRIDYRKSPKYSIDSLKTIHAMIGGVSSDIL